MAEITNCTFIGDNAGADVTEGDGLVIIGDDIRDLDPAHNKNTLFLGNPPYRVAIGETLFGEPFGLKERIIARAGEAAVPLESDTPSERSRRRARARRS